MFQSRYCFRRRFLWPFSFPTYTLSFLPGVCGEMSARSKNPVNHSRWCSSSSFNLRPGLFLLMKFILRKFYASSLTTSFLFEGLLGRAFLAFLRERTLVALCLKEVEGERYGSVFLEFDDDWKVDPVSWKSDVIWEDSLPDTSKDAFYIFFLCR